MSTDARGRTALEDLIERMRSKQSRWQHCHGSLDVIYADKVDDWLDELEAELARVVLASPPQPERGTHTWACGASATGTVPLPVDCPIHGKREGYGASTSIDDRAGKNCDSESDAEGHPALSCEVSGVSQDQSTNDGEIFQGSTPQRQDLSDVPRVGLSPRLTDLQRICGLNASQAMRVRDYIQRWRVVLASPQGWEPIESAPKDGGMVLGFCHYGVLPIIWSGAHHQWLSGLPFHGIRPPVNQPTHWMPIPAGPVSVIPPERQSTKNETTKIRRA